MKLRSVEDNEHLKDKRSSQDFTVNAEGLIRRSKICSREHSHNNCFTVGRTTGYIIREYTTLIIISYTKRHNNTAIITYQQLGLKFFFRK